MPRWNILSLQWLQQIPSQIQLQIKHLEQNFSTQQIKTVFYNYEHGVFHATEPYFSSEDFSYLLRAIDQWTTDKLVVIDSIHNAVQIQQKESSNGGEIRLLLRSPFPYCISHIRFDYLIKLHLEHDILSIQPLSWLNSPHLQYLSLYNNCITLLKPLTKMIQSPKLKSLDLVANQFPHNQINHLSRVHFSSKLVHLSISWQIFDLKSKLEIHCINQLTKLQAVYLQSTIAISEMISQQVSKTFSQKFPGYGEIRSFYCNNSEDYYFIPDMSSAEIQEVN